MQSCLNQSSEANYDRRHSYSDSDCVAADSDSGGTVGIFPEHRNRGPIDYMNAHKEELREWLRRMEARERLETIKTAYAVLFFFVVWVVLGVILEYFV